MSFERYTIEQELQMFEPNTGAKHEIICKQKIIKKTPCEKPIELITCTRCDKNHTKDQSRFINCRLKGIKKEKIGYYKNEDKAICLDCIKKYKVAKLGDKVMVKYTVFKRGIWRKVPHEVYATGQLIEIKNPDNSVIVIKIKNKEIKLKRENILYKFNSCPCCHKHRIIRWQKNTKKFPQKSNRKSMRK
tara:strand:+ start:1610 stop:2176 length:567 start_codon:yes stop_codon:yes gene_type:complete